MRARIGERVVELDGSLLAEVIQDADTRVWVALAIGLDHEAHEVEILP